MEELRKKWLRIGLWLLVVALMGVVYAFSAQAAVDSDRTSDGVIRWLMTHFDAAFSDISPEEHAQRIEHWTHAVRKMAHFLIFAVLGFLAFAAFLTSLPLERAFPASLGLGVTWGVLDEVHQSFVPGRSCEFTDMGIDVAGVVLGAVFLWLILSLIQRKKLKR